MSGYPNLTKLESSRNCLSRIGQHEEFQFSKNSIVNVMEKFVKTVNGMDDTILVPCRLMDRQVGDSTDIIPASGKDSTSNQHTMNSHGHSRRGGAQSSKHIHEFLNNAELFNLYTMLNVVKNELLWTGKDDDSDDADEDAFGEIEKGVRLAQEAAAANDGKTESATIIASPTTASVKGHNRRPSTASVASTASVGNMSDSESDISNENDSGVESEGHKSDNAQSSGDSISSSEDVRSSQAKKNVNIDKATELAKRCRRHLNGLYQCLEQMTEAANYLSARYQSDIGSV